VTSVDGSSGHLWCVTPDALRSGVQPTTRYRNKQPNKRRLGGRYSSGKQSKKSAQSRRNVELRRSARLNEHYNHGYPGAGYSMGGIAHSDDQMFSSRGSSMPPIGANDEFQYHMTYSPTPVVYSAMGSPVAEYMVVGPQHGLVTGHNSHLASPSLGSPAIGSPAMPHFPLIPNDGVIFYESPDNTAPPTPLSSGYGDPGFRCDDGTNQPYGEQPNH
jgi:hypothetical protein